MDQLAANETRRLRADATISGLYRWILQTLRRNINSLILTADFFDGKHNIILGGSWATHPRVAGRKTL
jgi:L-histidine Nalpha-methyltransferase / hercynylcysteine S-oxide synthase